VTSSENRHSPAPEWTDEDLDAALVDLFMAAKHVLWLFDKYNRDELQLRMLLGTLLKSMP